MNSKEKLFKKIDEVNRIYNSMYYELIDKQVDEMKFYKDSFSDIVDFYKDKMYEIERNIESNEYFKYTIDKHEDGLYFQKVHDEFNNLNVDSNFVLEKFKGVEDDIPF